MSEDTRTLTETDILTAVDITPQKKSVILDSQILTTLMACACLTDYRFNHNFISINGKSNSLECGLIVHKFTEVYYRTIINGLDRKQALGYGMAAAEMYVKGCPICTGFVARLPYELACNCASFNTVNATCPDPTLHYEKCHYIVGTNKPSCGHRPDEYPGVRNTPVESEGFKVGWKYVLETCEQYAHHYRNDHWIPLEVEVVKQRVLYEDEEIRILWKAKLDRTVDTNQGIYPVDVKTMKARRDTISMNNQFKGQCIIMDTRNVFIEKVGFQKTLKPEEKFIRAPVSYTAERLIEWQSEVLPFYAKLMIMFAETGHWPRNYTSCETKYGTCAFLGVCESNPSMREEELKLNFTVGPTWNPTNEED